MPARRHPAGPHHAVAYSGGMFRRAASPTARLGWLGLLTLAFLFKAAVPLLASAAADLQGKTLVEVCTAYGVRTVALDGTSDPTAAHPAGEEAARHGGEPCALSGLLALAAPGAEAGPGFDLRHAEPARASAPAAPARPDATAAWAARLRHAPPLTA